MATAVKPKTANDKNAPMLSGNIPDTTMLAEELGIPPPPRKIPHTVSATKHSRRKSVERVPSTGAVARVPGAVARTANNSRQIPGKMAAAPLKPMAVGLASGPTAPSEENVIPLYPQAQLNKIMRDAYEVNHPITAIPQTNGLNMPPAYTEMTEPVIPSAPPISDDGTEPVIPSAPPISAASSNVLPAYNSIPHQSASNLANKWRTELMKKVNPKSIRSHNTKINAENLAKISEIISMFGANEHVYKLFTEQVYKIYSNALGTHLTLNELNKYIERYLDVFKKLLLKFGENFTAVSYIMDSLPTIRYTNPQIIDSIITHINKDHIKLEGVSYLIGKQDKISGLDAVMKYFAKIIATYKPNITNDQIVYFALYLNESIDPELYFGLWNDFHDYTQDISVYSKLITAITDTINSLELRDKSRINNKFVTGLHELLTDYVPQTAKREERLVIKNNLLNYFIKAIRKTKTIPNEAYFKTLGKQKEILTKIGYGDLLKGGARCTKTTIKKQRTHRKKHTRKL
jgi:hypothetical protein